VADDGHVIHFKKNSYQELIRFVDETNGELERRFLEARPTLSLDSTLGEAVRPGSETWAPVKQIKSGATAFGDSVHKDFLALDDDWTQYKSGLKDAIDIFEKHDDLATVSASEFVKEYPDLGNQGGGGNPG
jgi:hypothetical protein